MPVPSYITLYFKVRRHNLYRCTHNEVVQDFWSLRFGELCDVNDCRGAWILGHSDQGRVYEARRNRCVVSYQYDQPKPARPFVSLRYKRIVSEVREKQHSNFTNLFPFNYSMKNVQSTLSSELLYGLFTDDKFSALFHRESSICAKLNFDFLTDRKLTVRHEQTAFNEQKCI